MKLINLDIFFFIAFAGPSFGHCQGNFFFNCQDDLQVSIELGFLLALVILKFLSADCVQNWKSGGSIFITREKEENVAKRLFQNLFKP